MKLIDLSQTISADMPLFSPSAPQPKIDAWMSHADSAETGLYEGTTCELTRVEFVSSLGTYIDSPYHFNPTLPTIEQLTLDQLVLPGVTIDCTHVGKREGISARVLDGVDIAGKAVLFHTGWSRYWGDAAYYQFPFLTRGVSEALRAGGAKLAGVDFLIADDPTDARRPAHVILLNAEILIVENLTNLAQLPPNNFVFHAVPAKVAGAAAFPVRAYASHDASV